MIGTVLRGMTKWRLHRAGWLLVPILLLYIGFIGWRGFCLWRVQSHLTLRQDASANLWLANSLPNVLPNSTTCLIRSKLARRSGKFQEAETILGKAQKLGANSNEVEREQALIHVQRMQFDSFTKNDWMRLIEDPRDDEPEIARAFVAWANSRFQFNEAVTMLGVWEKDYPADPDPQFELGKIFFGMSKFEAAVQSYLQAIKLAPNRADIQSALAMAYKRQFMLDEAIHWYRESLRSRPGAEDVIFELAQSLLTHGELAEAKQVALDGLQEHPGNLDLRQTLGEILLSEGDSHAAIEPLSQVYAMRPEDPSLAYILANSLQANGRQDEAKQLFAFVTEAREPLSKLKDLNDQMVKSPHDVDIRFQIASITAKYKSRLEAKRWFQNILRINPRHRPTHLALAGLYSLTGEKERAEQHRQIAATLPP